MAIIKESVISDIIDLKDSIIDGSQEIKINSRRGSVAREANAGVLQFPVLTSTALSLPETTMIAKALERQYVSFVAIITSLDSVTDAKSVEKYIARIHQNVGSSTSNIFESTIYSIPVSDRNLIKVFKESEEATLSILNHIKDTDNECIGDEPYEAVNPNDLTGSDKTTLDHIVKTKITDPGCIKAFKYSDAMGLNSVIIQEKEPNRFIQIIPVIKEDGSVMFIQTKLSDAKCSNITNESSSLAIMRESIRLLDEYVPDFNMDILNNKVTRNHNMVVGGNKVIAEMFMPKNIHSMLSEKTVIDDINSDDFKPLPNANRVEKEDTIVKDLLRDNDVKKANELIPTTMHLKTYFKTNDGSLQAVDYMIGVKAVVHPVKSESMVDNLVRGTKRGKFFANVIKLTTGEISFFKDFVLAIDRTKDDIKTKYKDNSWWNSLLRRKKFSNFKKLINSKGQLVPNTTIVLTMDEAEKIKAEYGIDLLKTRHVIDLIEQYFLLGFVIVDSSIEVAHFMFDGQQNYQQYSFAALERENTNSSREVKNIMQVLGKL